MNDNASPKAVRSSRKNKETIPSEVTSVSDTIQPVSVERIDIVQSKHAIGTSSNGQVKLHNLSTGNVIVMGHKSATLLSDKYPQSFKILP